MTDLPRPLHMSTASAIRFRDPFGSHNAYCNDTSNWPSFARRHDLTRALTPPPEMNGVSHQQPAYYRPELSNHVNDLLSGQHSAKANGGAYHPQELSNADFGRTGYATQPSSRTISPATQARSHTVDEYTKQHNIRASQHNAIAPSFQIPRSVNDSGGSLSELAAQVSLNYTLGVLSGC